MRTSSVTAPRSDAASGQAWGGPAPRRRGWWGRRRSIAFSALGLLATVGCATAGLVLWGTAVETRELLVAARAIPAGHVVEAVDLRAVSVGVADGVSAVRASDAQDVLGRPATVPVAAGSLIPQDLVSGAGVLPPPGSVVVSVAVPPGVLPPQAGPGSPVRVLPVANGRSPSGASTSIVGRGWDAVLLGVEPTGSGEVTVMSLQIAEADAPGLTAAGADIAVIVLPGRPR